VAACVYIPNEARTLPFITELKDSKKIAKPKLEVLHSLITEHCEWAVAEVSVEEIDQVNILQASLRAMEGAFNKMSFRTPQAEESPNNHEISRFARNDIFCLVDGNKMPNLPCPARTVVKGDNKSYSIAAASIVAKVTRDRVMKRLHEEFPHYGWDTNAGYGARVHLDGINAHGITDHHRKSYAPVKNFLAYGSTRSPSETAA